jgi:uncharacterized protein
MKQSALRFDTPDRINAGGLQLNRDGRLATVSGDELIRQALILILSTRPGERVMRPEFGCRLHELLFAVTSDTTAGVAMHYVRQAVEQWEPRVEVMDVTADWLPDNPTILEIALTYRIRTSQTERTLSWAFQSAPYLE